MYYTKIPSNLSFFGETILGKHMCATECNRMSATSDEEGGCAKVRNCARFIELYPCITLGYETFNTSDDCLVVVECSHYKKSSRKPAICD